MIIFTWTLGSLLILSEMVKQGEFRVESIGHIQISANRKKLAIALLMLVVIIGLSMRFILPMPPGASAALGRSLALLGAVVSLWAAIKLFQDSETGVFAAIAVSAAGLVLAIPIFIAGGWIFAVGLLIISMTIIYLLWDSAWKTILLPPMVLGIFSLSIGLFFTYLHTTLMREALLYLVFYQGIEPISSLYSLFFRAEEAVGSIPELRVVEARQSMRS
jgi:hypothetical protein